MSLLEHDPDPAASSGRRPLVLLAAIALVAIAVLGYYQRPLSGPESDAAPPADPVPTVAPPPSPDPEPEPAPVVVPAPEPAPARAPAPVIEARPQAAPPAVRLRVTSDVDGADVFIDRQFVGKTPFESVDVAPGPHRLNVAAPGYDGHSEDIVIGEATTDVDVVFTEVRLDQRLTVVHRHRFGDCAGQLVANLDGIHYRTDGEDAFSVSFDALEEFEVDYLEHNLRVKVRDGRTYNFTDTEPNADELFVFHREVEDARSRLVAGS